MKAEPLGAAFGFYIDRRDLRQFWRAWLTEGGGR